MPDARAVEAFNGEFAEKFVAASNQAGGLPAWLGVRFTRFEPGAGGDYKFLRGFDARPTRSLHYLADPRLAQAIEQFLDRERDHAQHALESLHEASALKHAGPYPGPPKEPT